MKYNDLQEHGECLQISTTSFLRWLGIFTLQLLLYGLTVFEHCVQVKVSLHVCPCLCARIYPPPLKPNPLLSTTRFIAKLPCERVHMLCPVSVLHPDNYCYIYHSKWEPWTGVIIGWSRSNEAKGGTERVKQVGRESGRKKEERGDMQYKGKWLKSAVNCIVHLSYITVWDKLCFSLKCFLFKRVKMRLKGWEACRGCAAIVKIMTSVCILRLNKLHSRDLSAGKLYVAGVTKTFGNRVLPSSGGDGNQINGTWMRPCKRKEFRFKSLFRCLYALSTVQIKFLEA